MADGTQRGRTIALGLLAGAIVGLTIFGVLASRATTVERADARAALRRFAAIRAALGGAPPLLTLDDEGRVTRRQDPPQAGRQQPTRLGVLAYRGADQRLVTVNVPFWFFKLKGPAAQFAVRGTGLDFGRLRITATDLERYGPAVVVDHATATGDRLLVWTE